MLEIELKLLSWLFCTSSIHDISRCKRHSIQILSSLWRSCSLAFLHYWFEFKQCLLRFLYHVLYLHILTNVLNSFEGKIHNYFCCYQYQTRISSQTVFQSILCSSIPNGHHRAPYWFITCTNLYTHQCMSKCSSLRSIDMTNHKWVSSRGHYTIGIHEDVKKNAKLFLWHSGMIPR